MHLFDQKFGSGVIATLIVFMLCFPALSAAPLFARFSTDRAIIHAGEAFQITLAIHITGETLAPQISIDGLPPADPFQIYPFQELPVETVTLDGLPYEVRKFRAWARVSKAGSVSLAPRLNGTFIQTTRTFFMMQESRRPANIPVEALTLTIHPLPESGRPMNFSGLVGHFNFSVTPVPLNIALGDLITVTFKVEGDLLPATYLKPGVQSLPELKVYELKPVVGESTPSRHVFSQTIVPGNSNLAAIPACSLSFYDTQQMRYKTLIAGPFPIHFHAERAPVQSVYSTPQAANKGEASNLMKNAPLGGGPSMSFRFWHWLKNENTATVIGRDAVQVFFAPSETSQKLFTIKPGTSLTHGETTDGWIYISTPDGMGWVRDTAISP